MEEYRLELKSYQVPTVSLNLYNLDYYNLNTVISEKTVYSDKKYEAFLFLTKNLKIVKNVEIYINGASVGCYYKDGEIIFIDDKLQKNMIFMDIFGSVQIGIIIIYEDNDNIEMYSRYINVAIKRNLSRNNIPQMVRYIDCNYAKFLFDSGLISNVESGIKESKFRSTETYIATLKNIISEYEINYRNFKSNAKFDIVTRKKIDSFEKLHSISNSTLRHIITHPEELSKVNYNSGIKYSGSYYEPKKTLVNENIYSYDIYENRIVVGFLKYLFEIISSDIDKLLNLAVYHQNNCEVLEGYIISSEVIEEGSKLKIRKLVEELKNIKIKILNLYNLYKKILQVEIIVISKIPKPTTVFLSSIHYKRVYSAIVKWFKYGVYDFEKENLLLSILGSSQIYEYYALLKICKFLESRGYILKKSSKYMYLNEGNILYRNTTHENTFLFENIDEKISLYYQPVITDRIDSNKIGLFRNNRIPFSNNMYSKRGIEYYVPDFVIKIERVDGNKYLILDAKLSNSDTIKKYYLPELVYKYLFSLSAISENDYVEGLYIINGKSTDKQDKIENIYESSFGKRNLSISPNVKILTITENCENNTDFHNELMLSALEAYI